MKGHGIFLELFLNKQHPPRATEPENYGLSHLAFYVDDLDTLLKQLEPYNPGPVRVGSSGIRTCYVNDPDGTPIELKEILA